MQNITRHHAIPFFSFLFLSLLIHLPHATAEIRTLTFKADERERIEFEMFGYSNNGRLDLDVSSISVANPDARNPTNSSRFGFILTPVSTKDETMCILDNHKVPIIITFADLSPPPHSALKKNISITKGDEYIFLFTNCVPEASVSMTVHYEIYNLGANGQRTYLGTGDAPLPTLYTIFSAFYICFFIYWIRFCNRNKAFTYKIHTLMGALLFAKALSLAFEAEDKYHIKVAGTPRGWDIVYYIFQFIRASVLFTVLVLIGAGWSFFKPFLNERDKIVLMIGIPLQVLVNIAFVIVDKTGPSYEDWVAWYFRLQIFDLVGFLLIMLPVGLSISQLKDISKSDGRAVTNLAKLRLFRNFYGGVLFYLYVTRFGNFFLMATLEFRYRWLSGGILEITTLLFYFAMFYLFRPMERNEYFAVPFDEEADEAAMRELQLPELE